MQTAAIHNLDDALGHHRTEKECDDDKTSPIAFSVK